MTSQEIPSMARDGREEQLNLSPTLCSSTVLKLVPTLSGSCSERCGSLSRQIARISSPGSGASKVIEPNVIGNLQ